MNRMTTIWYVQHNNVILPRQQQHTVIMCTHMLHISLTFAYYAALTHVHLNQKESPCTPSDENKYRS